MDLTQSESDGASSGPTQQVNQANTGAGGGMNFHKLFQSLQPYRHYAVMKKKLLVNLIGPIAVGLVDLLSYLYFK